MKIQAGLGFKVDDSSLCPFVSPIHSWAVPKKTDLETGDITVTYFVAQGLLTNKLGTSINQPTRPMHIYIYIYSVYIYIYTYTVCIYIYTYTVYIYIYKV